MLKIFLIILAVLVVILLVLVILGKRLQKKQESQQASIDAAAQTMNFFIIDKKMMKLTEAGLPKVVLEQTPKLMRRAKLPILKVKIGPKVMSLICDQKVRSEEHTSELQSQR